jgi:hypothetical protein
MGYDVMTDMGYAVVMIVAGCLGLLFGLAEKLLLTTICACICVLAMAGILLN